MLRNCPLQELLALSVRITVPTMFSGSLCCMPKCETVICALQATSEALMIFAAFGFFGGAGGSSEMESFAAASLLGAGGAAARQELAKAASSAIVRSSRFTGTIRMWGFCIPRNGIGGSGHSALPPGAFVVSRSRLLRGERVEVSQHFLAVAGRLHLEVDLADDAGGIDEERIAGGVGRSLIVGQRAVLGGDAVLGVGEELEVEPLLRAEALVRV